MKTRLIAFLIFSIGFSGLGQVGTKPLSQYGTTNHLADGDLVGVSVRPFSAQEAVKGISRANLIADLALNPTNGINSSQASNIVNQILVSSNFIALAKLIATTNGLQAELDALTARIAALESAGRNLTNAVLWASNVSGVFPIPHWDIGSMSERPQLLGRSNDPIMTLRYSGIQPSGVNEGTGVNVIYIGDNSPAGKDAISLQMRNVASSGRLTFVFDDDLYTWRFQATNMTYAFTDSGLNWPLLSVNNAISTAIPLLSVGITNPVGSTIVKSSNVTVQSSSTSVGLYFQTNSTAVNGSLYMDSSGILWLRTNSTWVIK